MKLLLAISQTGYLQGMPDESHISSLKELIKREGYVRIPSKLAVQAKKFIIPRFILQKGGNIGYAYGIQQGRKVNRSW